MEPKGSLLYSQEPRLLVPIQSTHLYPISLRSF